MALEISFKNFINNASKDRNDIGKKLIIIHFENTILLVQNINITQNRIDNPPLRFMRRTDSQN